MLACNSDDPDGKRLHARTKPIGQDEREAQPARLRCPWRAEHGAITLDLSPAAGP